MALTDESIVGALSAAKGGSCAARRHTIAHGINLAVGLGYGVIA